MKSLVDRLQRGIDHGSLALQPDPFWCEGKYLTTLPNRIGAELRAARCAIFKGDLNYRRVFGDALYPPGITVASCLPEPLCPYITLRNLKSDVLAGIDVGRGAALDAEDPAWRTNGKRGIVQVVRKRRRSAGSCSKKLQ